MAKLFLIKEYVSLIKEKYSLIKDSLIKDNMYLNKGHYRP